MQDQDQEQDQEGFDNAREETMHAEEASANAMEEDVQLPQDAEVRALFRLVNTPASVLLLLLPVR